MTTMQVPDNVVNNMLKNLPAPMRQAYGSIVNGDVTHLVHCDSKTCKGQVIAHIMSDGRVIETQLAVDPKGKYGLYKSGLEGSRQRLDGNWGFRCYCGNNSILSAQEQGHIGAGAPSKEDIMKIAGKVQRHPTKIKARGGKISVDGFTIEQVKV